MRRLDFVDSLRGLAALYIVVYHMALVPHPRLEAPHWAQAVVLSGGTAVTLFFVVSAFSLCPTMNAHAGELHPVRDFFIRRLFRIAPLFYAMLYGLGLPISASFLLCFALTLGLVLPASLLTYHWIEAPGMKLGKQLLARKQTDLVATIAGPRPI